MKLPNAKLENIVVQDLRDELLIYNLTTHQAFTLNETLKRVYQSCDGQTSFTELKGKYQFTDDFIYLALDELSANDLLEDYRPVHFAGLSRREVIRKVGLAASTVALPLVVGLTRRKRHRRQARRRLATPQLPAPDPPPVPRRAQLASAPGRAESAPRPAQIPAANVLQREPAGELTPASVFPADAVTPLYSVIATPLATLTASASAPESARRRSKDDSGQRV